MFVGTYFMCIWISYVIQANHNCVLIYITFDNNLNQLQLKEFIRTFYNYNKTSLCTIYNISLYIFTHGISAPPCEIYGEI